MTRSGRPSIHLRWNAGVSLTPLAAWLDWGVWTHLAVSVHQDNLRVQVTLEPVTPAGLARAVALLETLGQEGVEITLGLAADHPALLTALELGLTTGGLAADQVLEVARLHLCEPLRQSLSPASSEPVKTYSLAAAYGLWCLGCLGVCGLHRFYSGRVATGLLWLFTLGLCGVGQIVDVFLMPRLVGRRPAAVPSSQTSLGSPPLVSAFRAELSVLWLALVGVVLVVISSGVLAAQFWEVMPPVAQYGLLLTYTLGFWGAGLWAAGRANLPLTAGMLQATGIALVPVNAWLLDRLPLPVGVRLLILAALLGLCGWHLHRLRTPKLWLAVVLGLAAGQLGTSLGLGLSIPLGLGTLAAAAVVGLDRGSGRPSLTWVALGSGWGLLLMRALVEGHVPLADVGLALGVGGAVLGLRINALGYGVGIGLFSLGLALTVPASVPWQASLVCGLGIASLGLRLRRAGRPWMVIAVGLLTLLGLALLWRVVPAAGRAAVVAWGEAWAGVEFMPWALVGVLAWPLVPAGMAAAEALARRSQAPLAQTAAVFTLILGAGLTALAFPNLVCRALTTAAATLVLAVWVRGRPAGARWLATASQILGGIALASGIALLNLRPAENWQFWLVGFGAAGVVLWGVGAVLPQRSPWKDPSWPVGLGWSTVALGMTVLGAMAGGLGMTWRLLPLVNAGALAWGAGRPPLPAQVAAGAVLIGLAVVNGLVWEADAVALLSLTATSGILLRLLRALPQLPVAIVALGCAIVAWIRLWAWLTVPEPVAAAGLLAGLLGLWIAWDRLSRCRLVGQALGIWGVAMTAILVTLVLLITAGLYAQETTASGTLLVVTLGLILATAYRAARRFSLAWGAALGVAVELLLAQGMTHAPDPTLGLALANGGLAVVCLVAAERGRPAGRGWRGAALAQALIGGVVAHLPFRGITGAFVLLLAGVLVTLARRPIQHQGLTMLGLGIGSLGLYELLVHQLLQAPSGQPDLGWVILAGLAMLLAWGYRGLAAWPAGRGWLGLSNRSTALLSQGHGVLGLGLLALALAADWTPGGGWGVAVAGLAGLYALEQGRRQWPWMDLGLVSLLLALANGLVLGFPVEILRIWAGPLSLGVAAGLLVMPWGWGGWAIQPAQRWALMVPAIAILFTAEDVPWVTLLLAAAFYAWAAQRTGVIRLSYLSVGLLIWALADRFPAWGWDTPLGYGTLVAAAALYLAQIDPALQGPSSRLQRHGLRGLATGSLGVLAQLQAGAAFTAGLWVIGLGLALMAAGLGLRVRAYLGVGLLVAAGRVVYQLVLFASQYALVLWGLGFGVGVLFLWTAASFETRRAQILNWMQVWRVGFQDWD